MGSPGQRIRLRSSARTSTGKVRDNNEDSVHLWAGDHVVLAVVADGMGGAVAGEEASRIAIEKIDEGLANIDSLLSDKHDEMDEELLTERMMQAIRAANHAIFRKAEQNPEFKGMGTTVTMAYVHNMHAILGHVGDSRAYLVDGKDGQIIQVTSDHSFVQALVAAGHISADEADDHPMKNVLYRALGQSREIEIDIYLEHLHVGDRLVLCSDGLTLHVKPPEIAQVILAADDPAESAQKLIELANQRGGRDNVSVIVIKVEEAYPGAVLEDSEQAFVVYDDEDTLILDNPDKSQFGSSESRNSPSDDGPQNRLAATVGIKDVPVKSASVPGSASPAAPGAQRRTGSHLVIGPEALSHPSASSDGAASHANESSGDLRGEGEDIYFDR